MYFKRLIDLREEKDLKQTYLAGKIMCDQSLYSKYESGKRDVPLAIMIRLADFYGTSVDYILGRTDERKPYPKAKQKDK